LRQIFSGCVVVKLHDHARSGRTRHERESQTPHSRRHRLRASFQCGEMEAGMNVRLETLAALYKS
jgi:hypothetical protein